jgi:hypothetical protein
VTVNEELRALSHVCLAGALAFATACSGSDDANGNQGAGGGAISAAGIGESGLGGAASGGASGMSGVAGAAASGASGNGVAGAAAGFGGAAGMASSMAGAAGASGALGTSGASGAAGIGASGAGGRAGSAGGGGNAGAAGSAGNAGNAGTTGGTAGMGVCDTPRAPAEMRQTIDLTWTEMTGGFEGRTGARPRAGSILSFRNTVFDQLMETGGTLNYCVRWDSSATVSQTMRDQIEAALQRGVNEWFSKLVDYDCWPYEEIPVKVVGWATRDRDLLQWSDTQIPIYVNDIRENAPQCAAACGRFFHQQEGFAYPECEGGADKHYDMSLWLTAGFSGGAGGDWGQRVASEYFTGSVTNEHLHIWLHELGHGLGMPDYYNWDAWAPGVPAPNSVMVAGRASLVTEWDTWMIRHVYSQVKSRFAP